MYIYIYIYLHIAFSLAFSLSLSLTHTKTSLRLSSETAPSACDGFGRIRVYGASPFPKGFAAFLLFLRRICGVFGVKINAAHHRRPFVGVSQVRSWSHWFVSVGKYRQTLINLM